VTSIAERPEVVGGVISRPNGLEIVRELSFNDWRRLMERLLETTDRAFWSLGDAWVYGERFAKDYHEALTELSESSRFTAWSARVSREFPLERRRDQLTFELHEEVTGLPASEQERWLDEAERHGWARRQMQLALGESLERVPVAALSLRAIGELHDLCVRAAERRGMDPKAWAIEVLERAAREELDETIEEAA
jgi:hypothetical protein